MDQAKLVYKIQDLVSKKELKSFEKFKILFNKISWMGDKSQKSYKFLNDNLKGIYMFCKILQHNPNSFLLAQALRPMFEMLLNNLIIPEKIKIQDDRFGVIYVDFPFENFHKTPIFQGRKIKQKENNLFIIPHTKYPLIRNENHLIKLRLRNINRHNTIMETPELRKMHEDGIFLGFRAVQRLTDFLY